MILKFEPDSSGATNRFKALEPGTSRTATRIE